MKCENGYYLKDYMNMEDKDLRYWYVLNELNV